MLHTTYNTQAILQAVGCTNVPVFRGAERPLQREPSYATSFHGETGLGGVTLLPRISSTPIAVPVASIADILLSQPANTVHLVATGPLTNIATMLAAKPALADHLAGLSVMGGAVGEGYTSAPMGAVKGEDAIFGNWTPWAEFNIVADPEAAHAVLSNKVLASKTTLIPLDLTHQVRTVPAVQDLLFGAAQEKKGVNGTSELSRTRRLMREIMLFFADSYSQQFSISDGPPLHDPIAVWAVLRPDMFDDAKKERWNVSVTLQPGKYHPVDDPENHAGQTVLSRSSDTGAGVFVPRSMEVDEFWKDIDDALEAASQE